MTRPFKIYCHLNLPCVDSIRNLNARLPCRQFVLMVTETHVVATCVTVCAQPYNSQVARPIILFVELLHLNFQICSFLCSVALTFSVYNLQDGKIDGSTRLFIHSEKTYFTETIKEST